MAGKIKKKHRGLRFLCGLILFLIALSVIGTVFLLRRNVTATFTPVDYAESNEALANPYTGWYHTYEYEISDETSFDPSTVDYALVLDNSTRLCLVRINLKNYAAGAISDHGLADIRAILSTWSATDKQMILRFCYDTTGDNSISEPSDLTTVYRHMEQVSDIINDYAAHIYQLQGIFVGAQGETLSSPSLTDATLADLTDYYASLTDKSLYLGLHDAGQYLQAIGQTSVPPTLFTSDKTLFYRLGLFNDSLTSALSNAEAEATSAIASFAPCGGSVAADPSLADAATAIQMLQARHISYLNAEQTESTLTSWKSQTYTSSDAYNGLTLYDYMTTHLGYRYVLRDAALSFNTWKNESGSLTLSIENVGFSVSYMPYDVCLLMRNQDTEEMITLPLDTDNRSWNPQETTTLKQSLALRDYDKGTYSLYLLVQNPASGEVIKLGNTMPLTSNGYMIGSLVIE